MLHASPSFPQASYKLYDNQPQCVGSLMKHSIF